MTNILRFTVLLFILELTSSAIQNGTKSAPGNSVKTRRKNTLRDRSTSSSSGDKPVSSDQTNSESLELSITDSSSSDSDKSYIPKSSKERHGWRKYHRKCTPCPERKKKWRDPTIKWICGHYQRARRSFKSECMMHYRNCQDGTMFTKLHDHRCANDSVGVNHGDHFFYEYKVKMRDDSSDKSGYSTESDDLIDSSDY